MLDLKSLTDTELAALLYAVEIDHDSMRRVPEAYKNGLVETSGKLQEELEEEYTKRKLDYSMWDGEEETTVSQEELDVALDNLNEDPEN